MTATLPSRYQGVRSQDLLEERKKRGVFRCMRHDGLWPLPWVEQDGLKICDRCADRPWGQREAQQVYAEQIAQNAEQPMETLEFGPTGCFVGVVSVTDLSPTTLSLTRGGASKTIALTGVNFSSSDSASASSVSITVTCTLNSSTSITLACSAATLMAAGDYDLYFNGDLVSPRGIFKVR